jgi:twitching motility protein PilT
MNIFRLLDEAIARNASDLHLSTHSRPLIRVNGNLEPIKDHPMLTKDDLTEAFSQITTPKERDQFERELELDSGYTLPDGTRLRCSAAQQRGVLSLALRLLPPHIPTIDELQLPQICKDIVMKMRGLIVISGPTGSGKTTTMAAMINHLNKITSRHVFTIEDPIEYFHTNIDSVITQRELGKDTLSYPQALKHVLRHDPDVILVGEMRDTETASAAISVAETGHLIMTTSQAPYAPQAIERIVDLFPPAERYLAQSRLSSLLIAVLCQTLVPRADGSGRIAAVEVMLGNTAIRSLIRDSKIHQLSNAMRSYRNIGMVTLDESLANLYTRHIIDIKTLFAYCSDTEQVEELLRGH